MTCQNVSAKCACNNRVEKMRQLQRREERARRSPSVVIVIDSSDEEREECSEKRRSSDAGDGSEPPVCGFADVPLEA